MARSVRVHEDTHRALKDLKARRRSKSLDQVIREMIRQTTGEPVEKGTKITRVESLADYVES